MDCCPGPLREAKVVRLRLAATERACPWWRGGAPLLARLKHGDFYAQNVQTALALRSRGWPRPRRCSQRKELNKPLWGRPLIKRSSEKLPSNASNTSAKRIGQHFIREIISGGTEHHAYHEASAPSAEGYRRVPATKTLEPLRPCPFGIPDTKSRNVDSNS